MSDTRLEEQLRAALHAEANALPFTITIAELERRRALRRRQQNGQRLTVMAAAIAAVAVGTIVALGNGWLRMPAVGTDPSPSPAPNATTSDGLPPSIEPTVGRSEVLRMEPRLAESRVLDTFDATTVARAVVVTGRCVGGDPMRYSVNGVTKRLPCDGITTTTITIIDVEDGGVVRGSIDVPAGVGYTLLIETPAPGEVAEPTPTPAPTPTPQPTPRTAPSLGDADDAVLIRVDDEPTGPRLIVIIAKSAAENVELLPFPIPAGERLEVERGQVGPGGWLAVPRSTEDQEPPQPALFLYDLADEGADPRRIDGPVDAMAWSPDGRLALVDGSTVRVIDPTNGATLQTVAVPANLYVAEVSGGRAAWSADGFGLLALDSSDLTSERGILDLDGTFARDPFPDLFAPTGMERFQDRQGRGLGVGCDSSGGTTGGGCAVSAGTYDVDQEVLYQQSVEGSPEGGISDHRWTMTGDAADGILLLLYDGGQPDATRYTLWRGRGTDFVELGSTVDVAGWWDGRIGGMTPDDGRIVIVGINDAEGRPMTASITADEQYGVSGTFVGWADPTGFVYGGD